jgi:ATP-binding cassette subfamily C (CFTR/MRP) protein 1
MNGYSGFRLLETRAVNSTSYSDDNHFGPFFELPGKEAFDFTLLFEETILSIAPSAILLLLTPPRILHLWKTPRKVSGRYLLTTKVVSFQPMSGIILDFHRTDEDQALLAIFSILQVVNVIEVSQSLFQTRASLAAALLALVAAIGLWILSYIEHNKNIRPSSIINAYLLPTLVFDAAQLRTRWLRGDSLAGNSVASSILALKLFILISEATEKRKILYEPFVDGSSPEDTSGLYSRGLFWWLIPLFRLGFRNVVNENDLFIADGDLLSESLEIKFSKHWANRTSFPPCTSFFCVLLIVLMC